MTHPSNPRGRPLLSPLLLQAVTGQALHIERDFMTMQLNPPPGWPPAPAGWTPPPGWQPDPSWPPPPPGWQLWVHAPAPAFAPAYGNGGEDGEQASMKGRRPRPRRHPMRRIVIIIGGSVLAVIVLLVIIGAVTGGGSGSGSGGGSPSATSILESDGYTPNSGLLSANTVVHLVVGIASQPGFDTSPPVSTAAGLNADQDVEVVLVFQSSSQANAYDQAFQLDGVGTDTVSGNVVTVTGSSDDFDFDCGATGLPQCTAI
jgi:hypothetical protein